MFLTLLSQVKYSACNSRHSINIYTLRTPIFKLLIIHLFFIIFLNMKLLLSRWILIHGFIFFLLHARPSQADPPGPPPDPYGPSFNPSMGVVIIVLIGALFFMGFFSIYIRHCSQDESVSGSAPRRVFMGSVTRTRRAPRGLDQAVIESFPTFDYSSVKELKIGKGALECAVCLNEFGDDDMLRLLPKCDHVFHPECIDAWLVAHTTCPVCRSDLVPRHHPESADVAVHVAPESNNVEAVNSTSDSASMVDGLHGDDEVENQEVPLHRNSTMRRNMSFGRPRWLGRMRFARSFSTGHVAVKQWEDMERFTLRLPEQVRKQLVSGKLERTTSLVVLPRETSSRRGYRTGTGFGEGSSRGGRFGINWSDRWVFSVVPPFFSRAQSVRSPKVMEPESRQGSLHGSVRSDSNRLPV